MTFESAFAQLAHGEPTILADGHDASIHLIEKEPFYVKPSISDIRTKRGANIYVVSAPGATGKSALAKYLAYTLNALYWNLAELTLGDNSFVGTLVTSVGVDNYSAFMSKMISGKTTLIIDAFDEAEMISGQRAIDRFLLDIAKNTSAAVTPCIVLLSRAETAQHICSYYQENEIGFNQYEISFFNTISQKEFVMQVVRQNKDSDLSETTQQCIDAYLAEIVTFVQEDVAGSFTGYAPVLEVIGAHVAEEGNAYKFLNQLKSSDQTLHGIDVVARIMEQLLEREQLKVIDAFQRRIQDKCEQDISFETIYSVKEQLIRIMSYVLFGEYDKDAYRTNAVPLDYMDEYNMVLQTFIPQHPFIRNSATYGIEFTGPAFRDFVLSELLGDIDNDELVEIYFAERRVQIHFPSHLLWGFYTRFSNLTIPVSKVTYLLESFKSQATAKEQAFLSIVSDGDGENKEFISTWSLVEIGKTLTTKIDTSYTLSGTKDRVPLENLVNVYIDIDEILEISSSSRNVRVSNSFITCKQLRVVAEQIVFDVHEQQKVVLVSQDPIELVMPNGTISEIGINGSNLELSIPNSMQYYKLIKYNREYSEDCDFSPELFAHCLRRIMVHFRKHRKDAPARDAEKIDYVVIGHGKNRKKVFDFLLDNEVIYREEPLYKINVAKMEIVGISWGAVTCDDTQRLLRVYDAFTQWNKEHISK